MRPLALAGLLSASLAPTSASYLTQARPPAGAAVFAERCAPCHGADGRGGERGPDIVSTPDAARRTPDVIARLVREGVPGGGMPAVPLEPDDVRAVASHVRTLAEAARVAPTWPRVRLALRSGRAVEGLALAVGAADLTLLTASGDLVPVERADISREVALGRAPMPTLAPRADAPQPASGDWPTYNGDVGGNRHSRLAQVTPANVAGLRPAWTYAIPGARNLRTTPLVIGGVMYVTAPNEVHAVDAATGRQIWRVRQPRTPGVIGDAGAGVNRGVAVAGDRLFFVTDDARIVALHRGNGQVLWETRMADFKAHYGATSAPLVVGGLAISGVSGGDEGVRGFVAAFDIATGREVWRTWTVPTRGEPGSETWQGTALEHGCAATWLTGSYDAALDQVLWTTGNPCPDYNGDERKGDNLWSDSVLALDPRTGQRRWHFQFTPHDLNDWDAVQTVIAADLPWEGATRAVLLQANRNGFFYVLDRRTGQLLRATPFVRNLNWATGIGADGRPRRLLDMAPSVRGTTVCPSVEGATNWMSPSFDPARGLYFVQALERCSVFTKSSRGFEPGQSFYGGTTRRVPGETGGKVLRAIEVATGRIAWELPQVGDGDTWAGVLSTASGLVFTGEDDGAFTAVAAADGRRLWRFEANADWRGSPMTYLARERQHIAIAGGGVIYAFSLGSAAQR